MLWGVPQIIMPADTTARDHYHAMVFYCLYSQVKPLLGVQLDQVAIEDFLLECVSWAAASEARLVSQQEEAELVCWPMPEKGERGFYGRHFKNDPSLVLIAASSEQLHLHSDNALRRLALGLEARVPLQVSWTTVS